MKKTVKKILASLLTIVMLLTMVPMMGITATAAIQSGTCGDKLTWTFNTSTGELKIDGTGAMYDYPLIERAWEIYEDKIKSVVIGNGVTKIGDYAFAWCDNLKSVTISNSITTIGVGAFYECVSLISLTIPEGVTTISWGVLHNCTSLTSIKVDDDNKYYSSDSSGVLYNKKKTELVQYPIGNSRTSFAIPNSVTIIGGYAFANSTHLTSLSIPDGVTTIGEHALDSCTSIKSIIIPDSVTTIGERAFYSCISIKSVIVPDGVTTIDERTFYGCTSLTSVTIPDGVTKIGERAFNACNDLADVYYGGSEKEWNKIEIDDDNYALLSATIHFKTTESNAVGDPNNDGKINSSDALVCLQHSVGKTKLTGSAFTAGDVDKNGKINSTDALKILQYSVGKIEKL